MKYLGTLPHYDPLHRYLQSEILPQFGVDFSVADFRVFRIKASNQVFLYEECSSNVRVIGKFFGEVGNRSPEDSDRRMEREFRNLNFTRSLGFMGYPHYIPRSLGRNANCNFLLVEEYCHGTSLSDIIMQAIHNGARDTLFHKLSALGSFLASLHNRTPTYDRVNFHQDCSYMDRVIDQLKSLWHIDWHEAQELYWLRDRWREKSCMWSDNQVLVHGDVTPTNILFGDDPWVIAIDLERMKLADRVFDVGRVAAEIKHFFMQNAGHKHLSEPFIGHFLWEYASHFPDRYAAFASITSRMPFYMGVTLLRIARNPWIPAEHRRQLIDEAKNTLR